MSIGKIDPNLASLGVRERDVRWISSRDSLFSVHGVYFDELMGVYTRMPMDVAKSVSPGVANLSYMCSGGRLRFVSDSPYVAVKASLPACMPMRHMTITGSHGFAVYVDGNFVHQLAPPFDAFLKNVDYSDPLNARVCFAESRRIYAADSQEEHLFEIYFPLYGGVAELYIGVQEGAVVKTAPAYKYEKPILFYGSSITQGACVSRPGNDYVSMIARWLDSDYINLGFSGCGNAEQPMLDYIQSIDASVYAYDYNLYNDRPERILPPHYDIYKQLRSARPDAAILLYDKPFYEPDATYERRSGIIRNTYTQAVAEGDRRVILIEAADMFGSENRDSCVADCSHPNDLGALRIAEAMYRPIRDFLENKF